MLPRASWTQANPSNTVLNAIFIYQATGYTIHTGTVQHAGRIQVLFLKLSVMIIVYFPPFVAMASSGGVGSAAVPFVVGLAAGAAAYALATGGVWQARHPTAGGGNAERVGGGGSGGGGGTGKVGPGLRVGVLGYGAIGKVVCRELLQGTVPGATLGAVLVRTARPRPPELPDHVLWTR